MGATIYRSSGDLDGQFQFVFVTTILSERRIRLEGYDIEALAKDIWRADKHRRFGLVGLIAEDSPRFRTRRITGVSTSVCVTLEAVFVAKEITCIQRQTRTWSVPRGK